METILVVKSGLLGVFFLVSLCVEFIDKGALDLGASSAVVLDFFYLVTGEKRNSFFAEACGVAKNDLSYSF